MSCFTVAYTEREQEAAYKGVYTHMALYINEIPPPQKNMKITENLEENN